jgi:UDP-N-acetylmuramoyl-tripeptide--D-alanyl-D-alanine ligase
VKGGWTDAAVRAALGIAGGEPRDLAYSGVSTDTRTLEAGALFVALRGERFDAHDFLGEAAARGARGAVVERVPPDAPPTLVYYEVSDTLVALGQLARARRRSLAARVCAVTGTNGKTTTKDMARAVLATRYRVHATTANLNNLVGGPLTLLAAPDDAEAIVVELGTNGPGEIARLGAIAEPDAAIITSVAEGHLEGLGGVEGVLVEKTSLLETLRPGGVALVADEPPELAARARALVPRLRVAGWTERADADLRAEDVRLDDEGRARFRWGSREVRLRFRGKPNARNALLALGLAQEWGVDLDAAVEALEALEPPKLRAELHRYGDLVVIADCYNANPASTAAALELLESMPRRGGRVAVLGTMRELGEASAQLHRRTAERAAAADLDLVVATGEFVPAFEHLATRMGPRLIREEDPLAAYEALERRLAGDEVILLKASRGVALERLLPRLEARFGSVAAGGAAAGRDAANGHGGTGRVTTGRE